MLQHETDQPLFTHVGWQHGTPPHIDERDHLALHLDAPPPSNDGVPVFQAVDDAVLPSPPLFFGGDGNPTEHDAAAPAADTPIVTFGQDREDRRNDQPTLFS